MVAIEDLTETELDHLHKFYEHLANKARKEKNIHESHSIQNTGDKDQNSHPTKMIKIY